MEKHEFKPKDWVLVRDDEKEKWKLDIFSHFEDGFSFPYRCVGSYYDECIPYAGNEALLGTTDAPEEKHVWHAGDRVDVLSDFDDTWYPGFIVEIDYARSDAGFSYRVESEGFKSITGKVWCKADQLRKPEEKPEEEDGWRPKKGEAVEVEVCGIWRSAVLVSDDHAPDMPYRVRLDNGEIRWCSKDGVRPALRKTEEPFKFGDRVEWHGSDGEWKKGRFILDDGSDIPFMIYNPEDNYTFYVDKEDVRRA